MVGQTRRVDAIFAALPESAWQRVMVGEGSKGPRLYDYAEVWVYFKEEDGLPGPRERLLARRSISQKPEYKYHRCNAPEAVPLAEVARVRASRWTIEEDIQLSKGECGLDEYETRGWIGWHHHTALALLALAFLVLNKLRLGKKRESDDRAGGPGGSGPPVGGAAVGHGGNPSVVELASGEESTGRCQPPQAAAGRAKRFQSTATNRFPRAAS